MLLFPLLHISALSDGNIGGLTRAISLNKTLGTYRPMATVTEQLNPTQIFKRQWENYQVVRARVLTGITFDHKGH